MGGGPPRRVRAQERSPAPAPPFAGPPSPLPPLSPTRCLTVSFICIHEIYAYMEHEMYAYINYTHTQVICTHIASHVGPLRRTCTRALRSVPALSPTGPASSARASSRSSCAARSAAPRCTPPLPAAPRPPPPLPPLPAIRYTPPHPAPPRRTTLHFAAPRRTGHRHWSMCSDECALAARPGRGPQPAPAHPLACAA